MAAAEYLTIDDHSSSHQDQKQNRANNSCDWGLNTHTHTEDDGRISTQTRGGQMKEVKVNRMTGTLRKDELVVCREVKHHESQHLISCREQQPVVTLHFTGVPTTWVVLFSLRLLTFKILFCQNLLVARAKCWRVERSLAAGQEKDISGYWRVAERFYIKTFSKFATRTTTQRENRRITSSESFQNNLKMCSIESRG